LWEEVVGGILIAPAASITFDLVFEGTNYKPELELASIAAAKKREQEQTASITVEECKPSRCSERVMTA